MKFFTWTKDGVTFDLAQDWEFDFKLQLSDGLEVMGVYLNAEELSAIIDGMLAVLRDAKGATEEVNK